MTVSAQEVAGFTFSWHNLAATTNHQPKLRAFRALALKRGWTPEEFDAWAATLTCGNCGQPHPCTRRYDCG